MHKNDRMEKEITKTKTHTTTKKVQCMQLVKKPNVIPDPSKVNPRKELSLISPSRFVGVLSYNSVVVGRRCGLCSNTNGCQISAMDVIVLGMG